MKDELQVFEDSKRIVRDGNKMKVEILGPEQINSEMDKMAKTILGDMPELPMTLSPQQKIFLTVFYVEVMNVPKALRAAKVTRRELTRWMQSDMDFCDSYNDIMACIKEVVQSTVVKNAMYQKDSRLLIKLLESWFPEVYSKDASAQTSKQQEQMEIAAMIGELKNGK